MEEPTTAPVEPSPATPAKPARAALKISTEMRDNLLTALLYATEPADEPDVAHVHMTHKGANVLSQALESLLPACVKRTGVDC